jgi:aryl-alcohol dehydrogenase-like predicted oxidoreductase
MQPRRLGNSDVHVSPVVFGAWAIGGWMWGGTA